MAELKKEENATGWVQLQGNEMDNKVSMSQRHPDLSIDSWKVG